MAATQARTFACLDTTQQLEAELLKCQLRATKEASLRMDAERTIHKAAQQVSTYRKEMEELQWAMARAQFVALSDARCRLESINRLGHVSTDVDTPEIHYNERRHLELAPMGTEERAACATELMDKGENTSIYSNQSHRGDVEYTLKTHVYCIAEWREIVEKLVKLVELERDKAQDRAQRFKAMRSEQRAACEALTKKCESHEATIEAISAEMRTLREKVDTLTSEVSLTLDCLSVFQSEFIPEVGGQELDLTKEVAANGLGYYVGPTKAPAMFTSTSFELGTRSPNDTNLIVKDDYPTTHSFSLSKNLAKMLDWVKISLRDYVIESQKLRSELQCLKELRSCDAECARDIFEQSAAETIQSLRSSFSDFHRSVLFSFFDLYSRAAEDRLSSMAIQTNLKSVCEKSDKVVAMAKLMFRRERQALLATHAVELAAATQGATNQQHKVEEFSSKLTKALSRESHLRRQLKQKESEIEVLREVNGQRTKDLQRKQSAFDDLKSEHATSRKAMAALSESLKSSRARCVEIETEMEKSRGQLHAYEREVSNTRILVEKAVARHLADVEEVRSRFAKESHILQILHTAECKTLREESERLNAALAQSAEAQATSARSLELSMEEIKVLRNLVNTHEVEVADMRDELTRARSTLEEGLRRWSVKQQRDVSTQCCDDRATSFEMSLAEKASQIAEERIRELEKENADLRIACNISVNQSIELLEALHRKRAEGLLPSF